MAREMAVAIEAWDTRLARALVRPLAGTRVSPSHVTAIGLIIGLGAGGLFATGSAAAANIAAGLFMLFLFLDHADGELARLTGKTSTFGQQFDSLAGSATLTALFIGMGIGLSRGEPGSTVLLLLGLAAGFSQIAITAVRMGIRRRFGTKPLAHPGRFGIEIEDALYLIGPATWLGYQVYFFVPFSLGTFGYLGWMVWLYTRGD